MTYSSNDHVSQKIRLCSHTAGEFSIWVLAHPALSCVTLGKSPTPFEPHFPRHNMKRGSRSPMKASETVLENYVKSVCGLKGRPGSGRGSWLPSYAARHDCGVFGQIS